MRCPALAAACCLFAVVAPAQTADWRLLPVVTGSGTKGLAFDSARGRVVMFESRATDVARTWEWLGANWSLRRTSTTPPPREGFAAGYDVARQRFVMFGGTTSPYYQTPATVLNDTWEYDGIDWVMRTPLVSPPAQAAASLDFDYVNNKLLLCEVYSATAASWLYDGSNWTPAGPGPFVSAPYGVAFASDPIRRRIVAVTYGSIWGTPANTTVEWDGGQWIGGGTQPQPPRYYARLAYVEQRQAVLMYGGSIGNPPAHAPDLWEWNGTSWNQIPGGPAPPRRGHTMAHDAARNRTIVVGGYTSASPTLDTLQWDGATWHGGPLTLGPYHLVDAAFDGNRQTLVATAGIPGLFEWDGASFRSLPGPAGMSNCTGLAFDTTRARLVVLGTSGLGRTTWEFDGTSWSQPVAVNGMACSSRLFFHASRNRVMACCGLTGLWEWNGTAWNQAAPSPGNGFGAAATYDAARDEVVALGPFVANALQVATWDGVAWTQHNPTASPPLRTFYVSPTLGYDAARQRVVLFGGRDPNNGPTPATYYRYFSDLWEWDGTTWSQRVTANAPTPRDQALVTFDPVRQQLLVLGGLQHEYGGASTMFSDVWALDAAAAATVTTLGPGCGGTTGMPTLVPSAPHPGAPAFTIYLHSQQANAPSLFLFAFANATAPLGPGCTSFVPAPDQIEFTLTNANGFASAHTSIPLALQGFPFSAQAAVLDPTNPLGFSTTAGLRITVGR